MGSLFASELRRFRGPALVAAAVHFLVLGVVAAGDELFHPSPSRLAVAAMAYALAGLLLGFYQVGSYRRGQLWTFLVHRPLAPQRIFFAFAAAAA